jgi:hypothetical protein
MNHPVKFSKKLLPSRQGLKALGQTQRTITDYAKATPLLQTDVEPASILQAMRKPRNA